ncbi:hypothetical protein MMC26_004362 [Xylographa opegraphella]|nr:hypothetical protein [Xylographa opegraphella]
MSGAFGDLGTLMPLFLGLAQNGSISVSSTLVFMGLSNMITGAYFGIPLPVQPMKAIAAVAIAGKYTPPQLASAGLFVAATVGFLSVTGLVRWFTKRIPLPIVKGIQVGTGLSLIISAGGYIPLNLSSAVDYAASIIAVTYLATDLIPELPETSATAIGCSVSLMNLIGCWFSAMPICHGSGGLAAQYRFGARSGASIMLLGLIKLLLGLFASEYVLFYSRIFWPVPLGVLLFLAGVGLAKMGESLNTGGARDLWESTDETDAEAERKPRSITAEERMMRWTVMIATMGAILAFKNNGVGFIVGLLIHITYNLLDRVRDWGAGRHGTIRLNSERSEGSSG